jgi:hypothetical protein
VLRVSDESFTVTRVFCGAHNFYWVSIVHTIYPPCFPRPPQATENKKKQKQKQTVPRADKKKKIPVGCQIFRRTCRIEKHIPICAVEWDVATENR